MRKSLSDFTSGESGTVVTVKGEGMLKRRIFDMGITPGAEITMRKTAPLGDPIELTVRGYELSLRKAEAQLVIMESKGGAA